MTQCIVCNDPDPFYPFRRCNCFLNKMEEKVMTQCTKQFDPLKPYVFRDGTAAKILAANRNHELPLVILYRSYPEGKDEVCFYPKCGHYSSAHIENFLDLINVNEEKEIEKEEINNELIRLKEFLNEMMRKVISFQERWIFK